MSLSEGQKRRIEANIGKLDYLKGTGILSSNRKHLADELFVFISTGGVGRSALVKLKQTIRNQIDKTDIDRQIMFLAIDTAMREQEEAAREELCDHEVLKIPFAGAHESINPNKILPQLKEWVHEDLWKITGGDAASSKEFNGTGAGAIRQCGRVLFAQSAVQNELNKRLQAVRTFLGKMGGTPKIKVFFLCGIAGGTGSGTILDLTFLTRHFLSNILGQAYGNASFYGYLFLPSACGDASDEKSGDTTRGNRNAYAALKEIDYYMTLTNRSEHFIMDYGTAAASNVDIADNLFDFCTLVEGVGDGGQFFENNAETSRQIVADSILNIICANDAKPEDGKSVFLVDSFHSNMTTNANACVEKHSDLTWPRDANYIYSVIGYSSCIVPIDLLTVYVSKKIFDAAYKQYKRAEQVNEEVAEEFLDACGLGFHELAHNYQNMTPWRLEQRIQAQCDDEFCQYGPFYMVNLTKQAAELIVRKPNDYLNRAYKKENSPLAKSEKWGKIQACYRKANEYLKDKNGRLYEVYKYAIIVLKQLLEKNARLLTDTKEYDSQFGKTFCWSPIDLTPGKQATIAVAYYLDEMLDEKAVKEKAQKFTKSLLEKRDEWTELTVKEGVGIAKFDVATAVREFVYENLKECVDTTLEEFIVKAYSGVKDAPVFILDAENKEVYSEETRVAANEILKRLSENANALASTKGFELSESYSNNYLTLPANCKWFSEAVSNIAQTYGISPDHIYNSSAQDRVAFYRLYAGVPAWSLYWTAVAEDAYEGSDQEGPNMVGLHLEQGKHGKNHAELPNLYPEKLWKPAQKRSHSREAAISQGIQRHMQRAKELSLLKKDEQDGKYYTLLLLKGDAEAEELMKGAELAARRKYTIGDLIDILQKQGKFEPFKINFANMVMTTTDAFDEKGVEAFRMELACRTIRRFHGQYKRLEKMMPVLEALNRLNEERNQRIIDPNLMDVFIKGIKWRILTFDDRHNIWKTVFGDEKLIGQKLDNKFKQCCAHYYGYLSFSKMDPDELEEIKKGANELEDEASDEEIDKVRQETMELKHSLTLLRESKKMNVNPWPENSPFAVANASAWPMASLDFVERAGSDELAESIRGFYTDLIHNL